MTCDWIVIARHENQINDNRRNDMKRRNLISLILALVLMATSMMVFHIPAAAEISDMPATLPNGNTVDHTKTWLDWSALGLNNANAELDGEFLKITQSRAQCWSGTGNTLLSNPYAWRSASGVMFYVDAASNGCSAADFMLEMLSDGLRPKADGTNGFTQLNTIPNEGKEGVAYLWANEQWNALTTTDGYFSAGETLSGWVYLPFTSIWYKGGSAGNRTDDTAYGTDFETFMSSFVDARVIRISVRSGQVGLLVGDVRLVYHDAAPIGERYAKASLFQTMTKSATEGTATSEVVGNEVTVSGMTGNSVTVSKHRAWLNGLSVSNLNGASGLRFWVDTTKLGNAALQLRLRLMSDKKVGSMTTVYASGSGNFDPSKYNLGNPQFVCRAENSVAYYYDADGTAKAIHIGADASKSVEADLFEALPIGYSGCIYIPFESFWMSGTSYNNINCTLSFSAAGAYYPLTQIAICHAISGTAEMDEVTYRDFEVVYDGTSIAGASLSLTNNLNVNFYAKVADTASEPTMRFQVGSRDVTVDGVKQENGLYKFVCAEILPQKISDTIYATLNAKIGENVISTTMTYSVREYCERMLAKADTSDELKTLLVDLLYYGETAQVYADYKTDDLATKNLTEGQKALRSSDTTGAITSEITKTGTADASYRFETIALRLENTLALKLKLHAQDTSGLTAEMSIGGRTTTVSEFDGTGTFVLIFNNIGATEMDSEITLVLKKDGAEIGEKVTCNIAAYIKELLKDTALDSKTTDLIRAIYAYGQSASAYAATVQ